MLFLLYRSTSYIDSCSMIRQNYIMWHWIIWPITRHYTFWGGTTIWPRSNYSTPIPCDSTCQSLQIPIFQEGTAKVFQIRQLTPEMRLNNSEYTPGIVSGVGSQEIWITVLDHVCTVFKLSLHNNLMSVLQLQRNIPQNTPTKRQQMKLRYCISLCQCNL